MPSMPKERVLSPEEVAQRLSEELPQWKYEDHHISREYTTKNWKETIFLLNAIAYLAEAHNHHPDLEVSYKRIKVLLRTHDADGITEKDIRLAREIENLPKLGQTVL